LALRSGTAARSGTEAAGAVARPTIIGTPPGDGFGGEIGSIAAGAASTIGCGGGHALVAWMLDASRSAGPEGEIVGSTAGAAL
jgi:hypothetical protein